MTPRGHVYNDDGHMGALRITWEWGHMGTLHGNTSHGLVNKKA